MIERIIEKLDSIMDGNISPEMLRTMQIFNAIKEERVKQDAKHGTELDEDPFFMLAVLVEEVGEVAEAMGDDGADSDHTREELVQVAATAVKMIEHIDYRRNK